MSDLESSINIEFEKNELEVYGCGPSVNAIFCIKTKIESEIWYKTELIEIETNKKKVYYIRESDGKLRVGHGMCLGAFEFNTKGYYKVRFTPMTIDGSYLTATNWITFKSPLDCNKSIF